MKEKNWEGIIDNIIDLAGHRLNDWEQGFIDDITLKCWKDYNAMSDPRKKKLLEIQSKYLKY